MGVGTRTTVLCPKSGFFPGLSHFGTDFFDSILERRTLLKDFILAAWTH